MLHFGMKVTVFHAPLTFNHAGQKTMEMYLDHMDSLAI